jgi:UDP-N-acetylmuramate--alanine ligase
MTPVAPIPVGVRSVRAATEQIPAVVPVSEATGAGDVDLSHRRRIHIVGVGGAGMSAIATVLVAMGHHVTGSDLNDSAVLARIRSLGVGVEVGHRAANVGDAELVTVSTAIPATNPEVVEANRRSIPVLRRAQTLAAITAGQPTVSVAGTHGKTTTSSMIALVLMEGGLRPSFIVGGDIRELGGGAAWNDGDWLVVEADESDGTFVELRRDVAVVTSVEPDHLDHYGGFAQLEEAFRTFLAGARQARIVCADDPGAARLGAEVSAVTYGTSVDADYQMVEVKSDRGGSRFTVVHGGQALGEISLPVPGLHNARNACAAITTGLVVGAPFDAAQRALGRFGGVARRFEFRGERDGVTYVDDYAHLPGEVRPVLAAARQGGWGRIVTIFQPHRYSRTEALWRGFADAFVDADLLVVTDIYSAGEAARPGVHGGLIAEAVSEAHPEQQVVYVPGRQELLGYLSGELRSGDLCLTLGAGDLTLLPDQLLAVGARP